MKSSITIRKAKRSDFKTIAKLDQEIYPVEGGWPYTEFIEDFTTNDSYYIVAESSGAIIGYAACLIDGNKGELTMNTIIPEFRGSGLGKILLEKRLSWLEGKGAKSVELQTRVDNSLLINFVTKYGFKTKKVLKNYYGENSDALLMFKKI